MQLRPYRGAARMLTDRLITADDLAQGGGNGFDPSAGERRDDSPLGIQARRLERLLAGVLRIHEAGELGAVLKQAARAVADCVAAEWVVLRWSPPGELSQLACFGVENTHLHVTVVPLLAPRLGLASAVYGELKVGRAFGGGFDRYDQLLL